MSKKLSSIRKFKPARENTLHQKTDPPTLVTVEATEHEWKAVDNFYVLYTAACMSVLDIADNRSIKYKAAYWARQMAGPAKQFFRAIGLDIQSLPEGPPCQIKEISNLILDLPDEMVSHIKTHIENVVKNYSKYNEPDSQLPYDPNV